MPFIPSDLPEAQAIRLKALGIAAQIAAQIRQERGLNVEVHEISPTLFGGRTAMTVLPASQATIAPSSAVVMYGWFDAASAGTAASIRIQRGREFLTDLTGLESILAYNRVKEGVDAGFESWGIWREGEDLSLGFRDPAPTAAVTAFPLGFAIIPEGRTTIYQTNP